MAIEFLLTISVLIAVFLLMLQYAVKAHAERIATAAAEEALAAAAAYDGTAAEGQTTGEHYLTDLGSALDRTTVTVTRTGSTVTARVDGDVTQLFPFLPVHIDVQVTGPVEHFVASEAAAP